MILLAFLTKIGTFLAHRLQSSIVGLFIRFISGVRLRFLLGLLAAVTVSRVGTSALITLSSGRRRASIADIPNGVSRRYSFRVRRLVLRLFMVINIFGIGVREEISFSFLGLDERKSPEYIFVRRSIGQLHYTKEQE